LAIGRAGRNPQGQGGLLPRQSCEVTQLDESGLEGIALGELGEGRVDGQDVIVGLFTTDKVGRQFLPSPAATVLATRFAAGVFDENAAHGLGGSSKKVASAVEVLIAHESQVGFVDQGRCVECLARPLLGQLLRSQLAQFGIDQRHELSGGVRVAPLDAIQKLCHLTHAGHCTAELRRVRRPFIKDRRVFAQRKTLPSPQGTDRHLEWRDASQEKFGSRLIAPTFRL
jgi:hypothetical protein